MILSYLTITCHSYKAHKIQAHIAGAGDLCAFWTDKSDADLSKSRSISGSVL